MNYIKGFLSFGRTTSNGEVQSHGVQPTNFNSVTFTTTTATSGNSIIITTVPATPQSSQQILYHNNQKNINELNVPQMASPTESYHSTASNFDQSNGKVNLAFTESTSEINNNSNNNRHIQPHQNQMVVREQYWTWNFFWTRWNNREKVFLIIIIVLSLCVLALTSVLSVVLQKNFQYRDIIFSRLGSDVANFITK